eukprot:scaffold955_cov139-Isochrysis_galbana.AAC.1
MRRGGCVLLRAGWCLTGGESESQGGSPGTMCDFAPHPPPRSTTPRRRSSFKGAGAVSKLGCGGASGGRGREGGVACHWVACFWRARAFTFAGIARGWPRPRDRSDRYRRRPRPAMCDVFGAAYASLSWTGSDALADERAHPQTRQRQWLRLRSVRGLFNGG